MKIKVTIDIYSGRPNPVMVLEGRRAADIIEKIRMRSSFESNTDSTVPEPFNLGYRGIIIDQLTGATSDMPATFRITPDRAYSADSSAALDDTDFEKILFENLDDFKGTGNKAKFRKLLENEIEIFRRERPDIGRIGKIVFPPINPCHCAPDPDLDWWNDEGQRQANNNCYNYSTNYRSDTFAQPGKAAGQQYTSLSGCTVAAGQRSAKDGAIADCLIDMPDANNICPPKGHLVALVIWPGADFHWYRKGPDGKWTHKPGGTKARAVDNSGNPIDDPRTANRGSYTQFCTFMQVLHGHLKIK